MAAYLFHYLQEHSPNMLHGAKDEGGYRAHIANHVCGDFQVVWDIADGHKHVKLRRANREREIDRRALRWSDATNVTWEKATFSFAESEDILVVERASGGDVHVLRVVVEQVVEMWNQLLHETGI
jgi:hypothetical protein